MASQLDFRNVKIISTNTKANQVKIAEKNMIIGPIPSIKKGELEFWKNRVGRYLGRDYVVAEFELKDRPFKYQALFGRIEQENM